MTGLLLRLYPRAWRLRYGVELQELILETSGGGRIPWRVRLDVGAGALRERLRAAGLAGDPPPAERTRAGILLVLCAWALFVVGGVGVQKFAEHWQAATPVGDRALPAAAFDVLLVVAAAGSALVLAGVALATPALVRFLRAGGWPLVRGRILVSAALTAAAGCCAGGLAVRGSIVLAAAAVVLMACCLVAWTVAAVACARRVHLSQRLLAVESALATGVTLAMAAMTVATAVWWAALAGRIREVFAGGSVVPPQLLVALVLMLIATAAGGVGARRAAGGTR